MFEFKRVYDEGLMYFMNVFNYLKFVAFACVSATSVLRLSCASSSSTQSVAAVACISLWCVAVLRLQAGHASSLAQPGSA